MKKGFYIIIGLLLISNAVTFWYLSANERREKRDHKRTIKRQNEIIDSLKHIDAILEDEFLMMKDRLAAQQEQIKELESRPEKIHIKYVPLYKELQDDTSALIKYLKENL